MTTTETASAAIDLTDFLPQDEATVEMLAPGGKQTGWMVTLAGPSHPKRIAANDAAARKALQRSAAIEQAQINGKKYTVDKLSPDEVRRETIEGIVARIVTWTPIRIGAEEFKFSDGVAVDLLLRPAMSSYLAQIAEAQADETRFTKASATS